MTKIKNKTKKQGTEGLKKSAPGKTPKEKKSISTEASDDKQQQALKKNKLNKVKKSKTNKDTSKQTTLNANTKQAKWIEHFRSYVKNIKTDDSVLQTCITAFLKTDSIPRRESKFKNYLAGSLKITSAASSKIWEAVKGAFELNDNSKVQTNEVGGKANGKSPAKETNAKQAKKNQKRPIAGDEVEVDQTASSQSPPKKNKGSQKKKNKQKSN